MMMNPPPRPPEPQPPKPMNTTPFLILAQLII
jgi:hypothetical protein